MAQRRHDGWLLIRLAAQNVARRRLRAILLGVAVMLGVGIGFASFVAGWALREGMAVSFARMGADLVVVPRATLVNITASLLTVQPTDQTLAADLARANCRHSGDRPGGAAAHRPGAGRRTQRQSDRVRSGARLLGPDLARGPPAGTGRGPDRRRPACRAARRDAQRLRPAAERLRPARQDRRRSIRRVLLPQLRRARRYRRRSAAHRTRARPASRRPPPNTVRQHRSPP